MYVSAVSPHLPSNVFIAVSRDVGLDVVVARPKEEEEEEEEDQSRLLRPLVDRRLPRSSLLACHGVSSSAFVGTHTHTTGRRENRPFYAQSVLNT